MKKLLCLLLAACLSVSAFSTFAWSYTQHLSNEATFETLEEARVNGPAFLGEVTGRLYVPDSALNTYPQGTTYIYRSPDMYTPLSGAPRMNTNILVYTDQAFESKDAAKAYLASLGLTDIVDRAYGSIVLVTPANAETGFNVADQYAFYQLQSAMCNIGSSKRIDGVANYNADNVYYGGVTYRYLIGLDGGATFINNYIASTFDYITRIAGMMLVNGSMDRVRQVASFVPVFLVNPTDMVVDKYKLANQVDAEGFEGDAVFYFKQAQPLQKVVVSHADLDAALVKDVYDNFLVHALRIPVTQPGLNSASTLYGGYTFDSSPYSLGKRNPIVDGRTIDGINIIEKQEERFSHIKTEEGFLSFGGTTGMTGIPVVAGNYLDTWYEFLPDEVLDGTAAVGSVPLVLVNHGGGDDPVQCVEEMGWLAKSGEERFAMVCAASGQVYAIGAAMLPALVHYMLDTYPALDASRVYVTGYSMGGGATLLSVYGEPGLFAASVPGSPLSYPPTEEQEAALRACNVPMLMLSSSLNGDIKFDREMSSYDNHHASLQFIFTKMRDVFGMNPIEFDFDKYPYFGAKADSYVKTTVNNEYAHRLWMLNNKDGVPMLGLSMVDFMPHGLYQEQANISWDFMKHYSRNPETKTLTYNPYVK